MPKPAQLNPLLHASQKNHSEVLPEFVALLLAQSKAEPIALLLLHSYITRDYDE